MAKRIEIDVFDLVYNETQKSALIVFDSCSDSLPDAVARFCIRNSDCTVDRSPNECVVLKFENEKAVECLRAAKEVRVAEVKGGQILFEYEAMT